MGGACDGSAWVSALFSGQMWGVCRACLLRESREAGECGRDYGEEVCQVVEGREDNRECPELADHIRYEGVRLYGVNKPPPKRAGWRR